MSWDREFEARLREAAVEMIESGLDPSTMGYKNPEFYRVYDEVRREYFQEAYMASLGYGSQASYLEGLYSTYEEDDYAQGVYGGGRGQHNQTKKNRRSKTKSDYNSWSSGFSEWSWGQAKLSFKSGRIEDAIEEMRAQLIASDIAKQISQDVPVVETNPIGDRLRNSAAPPPTRDWDIPFGYESLASEDLNPLPYSSDEFGGRTLVRELYPWVTASQKQALKDMVDDFGENSMYALGFPQVEGETLVIIVDNPYGFMAERWHVAADGRKYVVN